MPVQMWHNSKCMRLIVPPKEEHGAIRDKLWLSEYGCTNLQEMVLLPRFYLVKDICHSNMDLCHVLNRGSGIMATVTLGLNRLREDEGVTDPEEEKAGCTYIPPRKTRMRTTTPEPLEQPPQDQWRRYPYTCG